MLRFKVLKNPVPAIDAYLKFVYDESCRRGYCFDRKRLAISLQKARIPVAKGQLVYEFNHLKRKLKFRAKDRYKEILKVKKIGPTHCSRLSGERGRVGEVLDYSFVF